ncbi:MAG TPA: radical SAM family heme chaperone HemW [Candidatus Lawsonibacter pullicola]|nr:radical SAM family heme chaperone HemW [Candidatus Lawsonibacter pullicola]
MADKLGIYIHIPFCRSKCDYCDFYSLAGREDQMDRYQKALLAHLKETAPLAQGYPVDSIYFGGGTPSYYGAKRIKELLAHLSKLFQVEKDAEITVECNPDSVDLKSLRILRKAGVNRLSMGMQSAQEGELRAIHRIHTPHQTNQAVEAARKAKFTNLSLDLIYGLPGQTMESWKATVEHALSLIPQHLSCYGLKVEEGTPLARRVAEGEVLPDDDQQADLYLWTVGRLERAGLPQYEISNFAKPGYESRHNLRYWLTRPYIGFGPGAHSDFGGRRYSFVRDLDAYIRGVLEGGDIIDSSELIPQRERCGEYLMLRLRTVRGVDGREYRHTYFMDFAPLEARLREFAAQGWAEEADGRWRLTPRGFLVSNQLIGDLLDRQEQASWEDLIRPRQDQP